MLELLEKYNLKYEDLNPAERETLRTWLEGMAGNTINTDKLREYLIAMKEGIENELSGFTEPKSFWDFLFRKQQDIYRRARLRNYMLLLAFLSGPEKAKKALEASLKNIKPKTNN